MCIDSDCTKARIPQHNPKQDWEIYILKGKPFYVTFCSLRSWFPKRDELLGVEGGRGWIIESQGQEESQEYIFLILLPPDKKDCAPPQMAVREDTLLGRFRPCSACHGVTFSHLGIQKVLLYTQHGLSRLSIPRLVA